jgi:hypothetical protein
MSKFATKETANFPALFQIFASDETYYYRFHEEWLFDHSFEYFGRKINWDESTSEIEAEGREKLIHEIVYNVHDIPLLQMAVREVNEILATVITYEELDHLIAHELIIWNLRLETLEGLTGFLQRIKEVLLERIDSLSA